jgi:hypothetical protein
MRILVAIAFLSLLSPWTAMAAATSPLARLAPAEQTYYAKSFNYTMDNIQPGQKFDWASYSGKGSITVDKPFVSKSGSSCRNFTETFTVKGVSGGDRGVGCKRGGEEGWCRLSPSSALTCALDEPANSLGIDLPSVNIGGVDVNLDTGAPSAPSGSTPGVSMNVDTGGHHRSSDTSGADVADSITTKAGKAAGQATGGFVGWFAKTFR